MTKRHYNKNASASEGENAAAFGARLVKALAYAKMTRTALAEKLGVSRCAVSNWTLGTNSTRFRRLEDVASATGVRPEWLGLGSGEMAAAAPVSHASIPNDECGLSPEQLRAVAHGIGIAEEALLGMERGYISASVWIPGLMTDALFIAGRLAEANGHRLRFTLTPIVGAPPS